jgi:hypothetical protein
MRNPKFSRKYSYLLLLFVTSGCGWVELGGIPAVNDPTPGGSAVAQGQLQPVYVSEHPGKNVSGFVRVFRDTTLGVHVVRLESFSAPNEPGTLQLIVEAGGQTVLQTSLRAVRGNQNYPTSVGVNDTRSWSSARVRSLTWADPVTADYGQALLLPTGGT